MRKISHVFNMFFFISKDFFSEKKKYFSKEEAKQAVKNKYGLLRKAVLDFYSKNLFVCACCGDNRYCFLTIDHIVPVGNNKEERNGLYRKLVKKNFPSGYQVLCMNCNKLKNNSVKCSCKEIEPTKLPRWIV